MQPHFSGKSEVYLEIAEKFKEYIQLGLIGQGEKLPSVRSTAAELGVNPNTVARAYSVLESEGFIRTLPKKGVYVTTPDEGGGSRDEDKKSVIRVLRDTGVSKSQLISWIEEVYADHD